MTAPTFSIRSVSSGGALNQFFPDFQTLNLTPVFCDAGTVAFTYPQNGTNWSLLHDDLEIAILLNGVEILELRSVIESTEGDDASTASDGTVWTYTCRTLLGRLDEAVIYPPLWPITDPVKHTYVSSNAGKIIGDFVGYAHTRGSLAWLSIDFTSTHDSAGATWLNPIDMVFNVGVKYSDMVKSLVDASVVEVRIQGRTLQAFNVDTLGTDKTTGTSPLRFIKGRDLKESPRKSSTRDLSTVTLLAGYNNVHVERVAGSGPLATWGRREFYRSFGHVETAGALDVIGDSMLAEIDQPFLEITHGLFFENDNNPQPVRDFNTGDWGYSDVGRGLERHRIKQWVASIDNHGHVTGTVTLNDLVNEQLDKLNRRLVNIDNGTTITGPSWTVDDHKPPHLPVGIGLSTAYYLQFNNVRTTATIAWSPVTTNSDGTTANDIGGYTARWRYASDPSTAWRDTRAVDNSYTSTTFDNINPGVSVKFQIECHDTYGHSSGYSSDQTITTAIDTTVPEAPSAPILTCNVGMLRIYWDGLDDTAAPQAYDFAGVEVHISNAGSTFTPTSGTKVDFLTGGPQSTTITTGLVYGVQYWGKLVAVDTSGNKSIASLSGTTTLTQVVNSEIGTGQVGLANTLFSDVGNLLDDGSFESAVSRGLRGTSFAGSHFSFDNATASNSSWSLRHDSWAGGAVSERFALQGSLPVKPGERVFGAADYRATSSIPGGSLLTLGIKWLDPSGNYLDSTGAINNVTYTLADNSLTSADNAWHTRISGASQVAPPGVGSMEIWLVTAARTAGTIWIDAVEIRRQIDTLLIADAAITNAKIGNLEVNNAKISDLSVGKLTVGTLSADITVSARIKTANTGARVELNSSGLQAYNSSGTQTVGIAASTGIATITGQFQSGLTSDRVVINPSGSAYPTIQFFPTTGSNSTSVYSRGDIFTNEATYIITSGSNAGLTRTATYEHAAGLVYTFITDTVHSTDGGGSWQLNDASAQLMYADNTANGSSINFQNTYSSWQAGPNTNMAMSIGLDYGSRVITMQGKFYNYVNIGPTPAVWTMSQTIGAFASSAWSYGVSQTDGKAVVCQLYNSSGVLPHTVTASSSTGFTFATTGTPNASSHVFAWVFSY